LLQIDVLGRMVARPLLSALALSVVLGISPTDAGAQPLPPQLFPRIQLPGTVGTTLPDGWYQERSSVELDALRYQVALSNESTVAFVVDQARLREVFTVRVNNGEIPVTVRWLDPVGAFTNVPVSRSTPESVQIEPGKSATWTMVVQRADGLTFARGDYRVMMVMANLRPVVSSPGGGTWGGRVADRGLWLRVVSVKRLRSG
jgi:hypothetical protein